MATLRAAAAGPGAPWGLMSVGLFADLDLWGLDLVLDYHGDRVDR